MSKAWDIDCITCDTTYNGKDEDFEKHSACKICNYLICENCADDGIETCEECDNMLYEKKKNKELDDAIICLKKLQKDSKNLTKNELIKKIEEVAKMF
jgi:hypothetical protein